MAVNVPGLVTDPDFLKLSPADQQATLTQVDPEFGSLSSADFVATVQGLQRRALANPNVVAPPPMPKDVVPMVPSALGNITSMIEPLNSNDPTQNRPTNYQPVAAEQTPQGHQAAVDARENAQGPVGQVTIGVAKGVNQTARDLGLERGINAVTDDNGDELNLDSRNTLQMGGKVAENIAEFMAGDEALKALSVGDRLLKIGRIAKAVEGLPDFAQTALEIGMNAMRTGVVGGVQSAVHGADAGDALTTGLETAGLGGAAELGALGLGTAAGAVGDAVQKLNDAPAPGEVENALRTVATRVGIDANALPYNFKLPLVGPSSTRDLFAQISDSVMSKAKTLFGQIDEATGNQLTPVQDRLRAVAMKLREAVGDDEVSGLLNTQSELEAKQNALFTKAAENGVKPEVLDAARSSYKQAAALQDVDRAVKLSTKGLRPEFANGDTKFTPEAVDPKQLFNRLNKLNDSGRLTTAFGGDTQHAKDALRILDLAQQPKTAGIMSQALELAFGHSYGSTALRTIGGGYLGYQEGGVKGSIGGATLGFVTPKVWESLLTNPTALGVLRRGLETTASAKAVGTAVGKALLVDDGTGHGILLSPSTAR